MHIVEIVSFLPPYGGYFSIEQACALREAGHEVRMLYVQQQGLTLYPKEFFTARYDRWWHTESNNRGTEIEIYQANFRGMPKIVRWNEEKFCRIVNEMFDKYVIAHGRPDVLHAQAALWSGIAAMQISQRTGIPYFVTEHFSHFSYEVNFGKGWSRNTWAKELIRNCYKNASCVIPVARELIDDTAQFFGTDYRYEEVSNITDVDFFADKTMKREPRLDRPFRLCCLAIANKDQFYLKGYDILAQAFSKIDGCELHIAGRSTDSSRFRTLFEQNYGKSIGSNIILHGDLNRDGVRNLLYQCDALVLASRSEVQPLVVMEALATGIPVVATEVVPQSERIEGAVLISPVDDVEALARNINKVKGIAPSEEFTKAVAKISSAKTVAEKLTQIFSKAL